MSLKSNFEYIRDWCNHRFLRRDEKVDVDLSNYYTKDEVDSNISSATPDLSEYMTVEDYQTDEEVVAAALNDLDGRIKTVAEDVKANSTQKGMYGQISRDESSGYLAVNKKPTTLGDKILIDPFIFPLGNSNDYNLAVVGKYNMYDHDIEGIECDICLRIRGNNGGYVLPTGATLYIHPMGSSDNPERAYEIAAVSSEEIVVRYHGGDEIYRFTINDPQLYSDGVYIPLTKTFVNDGYAYNRFISEEILESQELAGRWSSILTVDLAIPQTIAEAEMDEYGSLIWKAVPTLSDNILRDTAGKNYIPTNKAVAYHTKNFTKRFETEYTRGEDEIEDNGNFVTVCLGNYQPDFDRFVAGNGPIWQAGDVIDVPYKEVDVTDLMFHMNSDGGPESTPKSVNTMVYYTNQDYIEGIRYKRIADAPSDTSIKLSSLLIFRDQESETLEPLHPYYYFGGEFVDSESDGIKFDFQVEFRELIGGLNASQELNDDNGLISFWDGEIDTYLTALEVVWDDNNSRWVNKRQNDGYTSILDYYKFYYYANGKTYVASRSGNDVRPVDISKNVIEDLREEVKSLKSDKMIDIGFEGFLNVYNRSDLDITLSKAQFASGFDYITGFDDLLDSCDVSVVDKLFFGKVRNIYGKISTGANEPLEPLAFKILYTVSEGQISIARVLLAPSESAIKEGEYLEFEYSGGSTVSVTRIHREA